MKESETQKNEKKKITKIKTFSIPFDLEKFEEKTTTDTSKNSEEDIIKEAFKYHSQGNTSEATKYYQQLINQGCNDFRVFSNYGVILKNLGKLKEAEISTRKAIELKPDFVEAHSNLGTILKDLGKLKEAEISTRKAIELKPDFAEAHSNLGTILKDLGKLKEAEFYQRKAIEFKSGFAAAHNNLGNILKDLGKFKEAEFEYQKSHDINFIQNIDSKFKEDCLKNISLSKSQFRQDLFALSQLNFKKNGFFVEFGSCDGLVGSNSYLLEKFFNWNGILAEPAISWHTKLRENRSVNIETKCVWKSSDDEILFYEPFHRQLATIDIYSKNEQKLDKRGKRYKVKTISLLDLLERNNAPKFIDYLSIDTEGSEYEILNAFDFQKYKFKVITCEHNYTPIREKVYNLLIKKGYKRKLTNISRFEDWYVYDF